MGDIHELSGLFAQEGNKGTYYAAVVKRNQYSIDALDTLKTALNKGTDFKLWLFKNDKEGGPALRLKVSLLDAPPSPAQPQDDMDVPF